MLVKKAVPDIRGPVTDCYRPALLTGKKNKTQKTEKLTHKEETVARFLSIARVGYQGSSFKYFCQDDIALGIPLTLQGLL